MKRRPVGSTVVVGELELSVREVLAQTPDVCSYLTVSPRGAWVFWEGRPTAWRAAVSQRFAGTPDVAHVRDDGDLLQALFEVPSDTLEPWSQAAWRALDAETALRMLRSLIDEIDAWHRAGCELGGVRHADLWMDRDHAHLRLVCAERLSTTENIDETCVWRDVRLVGELAFEHLMKMDYPGGHRMAALLQDRQALADLGLTQPGLPQLLAGCVSPLGDLAFRRASDVADALARIGRERSRPLRYRVGSASTMGNYIFRQNNQDACGHVVRQVVASSESIYAGFFCVADGIGGVADGERASQAAVDAACRAFGRAIEHYGPQALADAPNRFARAFAKVASQHLSLLGEFAPEGNRGGTTFTGLLLVGQRAGIGHVGDSRAMLLRGERALPLTEDHTLERILQKLDRPSERARSNSATISRFLSTNREIALDHIDAFRPGLEDAQDPRAGGLLVHPGDIFLLTTDGAHQGLDDGDWLAMVQLAAGEPQRIADLIIERALARIERDNATALVVAISRRPAP